MWLLVWGPSLSPILLLQRAAGKDLADNGLDFLPDAEVAEHVSCSRGAGLHPPAQPLVVTTHSRAPALEDKHPLCTDPSAPGQHRLMPPCSSGSWQVSLELGCAARKGCKVGDED